ncbi:MAG TPA: SusC/RagA family TonB-linked outer membrane protein, partial [Puia sp.]
FDQGGLFKNTDIVPGYDNNINYARYNFRTNFDFDITDRLSAQVNTSAEIEQNKGPYSSTGLSQSITTILAAVVEAPPNLSPGVVDGKLVSSVPGQSFYRGNPLANMLGSGVFVYNNTYLNGSVRLNYKLDFITKGLSAHGTVSYRNMNQVATTHGKNVVTYTIARLPDNTINYIPNSTDNPFNYAQTITSDRETYAEAGFDYKRSFGNHTVSALLLYNQSKQVNPTLLFLVPHEYQGIVSRVTYNYKERYLAEVDLGYNGTENFAPGKRFGYFPAYSAGWVASKESFFPKTSIISFLKFRASYGEVGNDVVGGTRFLYRPSSYTYTNADYHFGTPGSSFNDYIGSLEGALGNPDLTWERAKKTDVGIDWWLFNDRVKITADWFREKRENILASFQTVPVVFGVALPQSNLGRMRNGGVDGEISFSDRIGNLNYWVKGTYTYAHNVIEYMDEVHRPYPYEYRTGLRSGQIFGLVAEGFYNSWTEVNDPKRPVSTYNNNKIQPGDIKYKDVNGDGKIDVDDQVPIGYSNFPEVIYGFSLGGSYGGFDFSLLIQGAAKVSFQYLQITQTPFNSGSGVPNYWVDNSWTQDRYDNGADIKLPHLSISTDAQKHNYQPSTFWNVDGSYLRLKNLEIGYRLPARYLKRVGVSATRIYLNGNNLLTMAHLLNGLDPEQRLANNSLYQYPLTKTFNLGINLNF